MGRFMSATGQFLMATHGQFHCPPTGSFRCPLTDLASADLIRLFALDGGLVLSDIVSCR